MVNLARDYIDILLCLGENDQTRPAGASEIESDDTSSESLRPNETEIGNSQEHGRATEAIDFEHEGAFIHSETFDSVNAGDSAGEAATASNGENDSVITAPIQIVEADKDNVLLNAPTLLKQPFSIRISLAQLTAEGRGIYAGLVMVEESRWHSRQQKLRKASQEAHRWKAHSRHRRAVGRQALARRGKREGEAGDPTQRT
ncbi:hypothetical protein F5883DRAFT_722568 [Diaporthe sp. PMI_573]|nr:hypothetical protein F5883DRAFT_722568 [Diaporthaceae sp. PMI_573]